jgi:SpoVK/Ycf46/Vps4 family AAA+-type ATPase
MATAEQLRALIKSHYDADPERFSTIAMQVAAHEARQGHDSLARDIRSLIDRASASTPKVIPFRRDLDDLVLTTDPRAHLSDLILVDEARRRVERVLREYRQQEKLRKHGLEYRRKLLLTGPPGTGKTLTASVLAAELQLQLHTVLMDKLMTKFMGETSAKLRQVFDAIKEHRGVYLFDEFDAIGAERGLDNDVGEIRRVLNAFLQFIERDESGSLIIAATNNVKLLDQALFRRFDDVLRYGLPTDGEIRRLIANRVGGALADRAAATRLLKAAAGLSHAEVAQACDDAIKEAILADQASVSPALLLDMLGQRRAAYESRGGE